MTPNELKVLARVRAVTRQGPDSWARAVGSGERVTLAALYRKGLLKRRQRTRDGQEGFASKASNAAYEYRVVPSRELV